MYVFLNNELIPASEAKVSVYDHGFLYGDGVYETMRAYSGVVFMLERHLERLVRSASLIRLTLPGISFVRDAVYRAIKANQLSEAYIRITVSRGAGPVGLDPDLCKEPTFVVLAEHFRGYPEAYYREGTRVAIAKTRRNLAAAVDPKIKSLNFLNNILAKIEAKEKGALEAVMLNADGALAEGTVSNIFFVLGKTLCTPSPEAGILDGITREAVIGLARENGLEVKEGIFYPEDLFNASEVFYSNTTSEVMPVSMVEDVEYPVGEMTRTLGRLYKKKVEDYIGRRGNS